MKLTYPQISAIYITRSLGLSSRGMVTMKLLEGRGVQHRVVTYLREKGLVTLYGEPTEIIQLTRKGLIASDHIRTAVEEARSQGKGSDQKLIAVLSNRLLSNTL